MKNFVQVFEVDLDINDTSVDWSSDPTSYNTPKTTDDPDAYQGEFQTYRWVNQIIQRDKYAFPSLTSIATNPPTIEPGKTIGVRATATVKTGDVVTNDTFELPSTMDDRKVTGSANQKLIARNYLINRPARVITGTNPNDLSDAIIENYFVMDFNISATNEITWNLVDPLYFTTESKAKAPLQSTAVLASDIASGDVTLTFTDVNGDYEVGETGYIQQGQEIYSFEVTSVGNMDIVRAQAGTVALAHSEGDVLQKMLVYQNVNAIDILTDLIENYTIIDNSFIPTATWADLKTGDLANFNLTNYIGKPTEVRKLINEIIEITGISMFFDTELQEITIVSAPRFSDPAATFTDELNIKQDSITVKPSFKNKITRQQINWGKSDYSQSDDEQYYQNGFLKIDGIEENESNSRQEFAAETITTNWLETNSPEDAQIAVRIPQLNVERFSEIPNIIKFVTDESYIGGTGDSRVWLASVIQIETDKYLGPDLNRIPLLAQITGIKPKSLNDWELTAMSYNGNVLANVDLYISSSTVGYTLSDYLNPVEIRQYVVVVNSGIDIGSFDTGAFPVGSSLYIINLGRIMGTGGSAPNTIDQGGDGNNGGNAINLQIDTTIDNISGFIGGGGGSGVNGDPVETAPDPIYGGGGGGGGGQGYVPGTGGTVTNLSGGQPGDPGEDATLTSFGLGALASLGDDGSNGGLFGEDGVSAGAYTGGTAGLAIKTNSYTLTQAGGFNSTQVKGLIS